MCVFLKLLRYIYKGIEIPDPDAILNNVIDANLSYFNSRYLYWRLC